MPSCAELDFLWSPFSRNSLFSGICGLRCKRGIGFWPAAAVLSLTFGAVRLPNLGGARLGAVVAAAFGFVASLSLKRTGTLWFVIGVHPAFDWTNMFFCSSPIAGLSARGHLMNTALHGPDWVAGGHSGPVGSVFGFASIALAGAIVHFSFPPASSSREKPIQGRPQI